MITLESKIVSPCRTKSGELCLAMQYVSQDICMLSCKAIKEFKELLHTEPCIMRSSADMDRANSVNYCRGGVCIKATS